MNQGPAASQPKGMAALSRGFYAVAHELTLSMLNRRLVEGGSNIYTASVVIILHACLEAYINEFLSLQRQLNPAETERRLAALQLEDRAALEDKWHKTPLLFSDKTFDKGAEPFQSLTLLVCLRNTLGHYDPRFRAPSEFPSEKLAALRTKFVFSYPGAADWTSQVLNLECARWGCRTVKALIPKFHEFVNGIDYSSGPYPWPDPP